MKSFDQKDTLVQFGGTVKSTGSNGKVGGHLVLFGSPKEKDLYGDFFTAETDYDLQPDLKSPVYYQHTFDYHFKSQVLSRASMGVDDVGIWIEAQLDIHDDYTQALSDLIDEGIMGWSSGTAAHLVEFERVGKAWWIKRWPLGLDASITPNPADPRQVNTLRSLQAEWEKQYGSAVADGNRRFFLSFKNLSKLPVIQGVTLETPSGVRSETSEDGTSETVHHHLTIEVKTMPEQEVPSPGQEQPSEIAELKRANAEMSARLDEAMRFIDAEKKLRGAGYVTDDGGTADAHVKTLGDFFLAVMRHDTVRLRSVYKAVDLSEDSGSQIGWMIPEDFSNQLLAARQAIPSFVNLIPRTPVSVPSGRWPRLDIFFTPAAGDGDTAEAAGLTSEPRAEGGSYTQTDISLEEVLWRVNDAISGLVKVTKEAHVDAPMLESLLLSLISINDLSRQEYFVLRGTGNNQPLGILNSPALVSVTAATNSTFSWTDVLAMESRLYAVDQSRVAWTYHPSIETDIGKLEVGTGGAVYIANLDERPQKNLYGYPRYKSQHLPQADNTGDVVLADWSQYHIWDLGGAYVDYSEHAFFTEGKVAWRFGRRMDGKPLWLSTMTLSDPQGSFTQSPFVKHDD